ncbi:MAG TPA: ATP-binding protein [Clostridia bacterium]|nr:ATP-binding protein [Clostridia bacterium]
MQDLSLHILDLIQNSVVAGASLIKLTIYEDENKNRLFIDIEDNGKGMDEEAIKRATDPFYTTRSTRKVGLGLPLFKTMAQRCGGDTVIKSVVGKGTRVLSDFQLGHIDRPPFGKLDDTMVTLILCNPEIDFIYSHRVNNEEFKFDTREVRGTIEEIPIEHPEILKWIQSHIKEGLNEINGGVQ